MLHEKKECGGLEHYAGIQTNLEDCARSCRGISSVFAYGTNDYGTIRCYNQGCHCYCETSSFPNGTCSLVNHNGYRLYKYRGKRVLRFHYTPH